MAKKYKLPNAGKKDSQGVCFLGQISLPEFLSEFIPDKKGKILDTSGNILGIHQGAHHFTIGQRRGLGVGGQKTPKYVASRDVKGNTIYAKVQGTRRTPYNVTVKIPGFSKKETIH